MRVALLVDDVVELAGDLVVDAAEVVALEALLALLAQLLEQLAQALQPLAVAVRRPSCINRRSAALRSPWYEEIVGDLVEQSVGVEVEPLLGAVPPRVGEASCHRGHRTRGNAAQA